VMFHTGIVMREEFKLAEDVSSSRMRPFHLEEIARRFPKLTVLGAHCGNPEYEWAAEVSRWNPNVFFDLSGSTLLKMRSRLHHLQEIFWWSGVGQDTSTPNNDQSAFIKLVFGSDTYLARIEAVVNMYHAVFDACDVPEPTRKMILGGTMSQFLGLPA
jgi:predicted TIM-barrel fold metal-dependent hydrolase